MTFKAPLVLVVLAALLVILRWWADARQRQRQHYREHRDRFFATTRELIRDESCSLELAISLRQIGATMNRMAVFWILLCTMLFTSPSSRKKPSRMFVLVRKATPEFRAKFLEACHEALLAVSYRGVIFGQLIRKKLSDARKSDRLDKAAIGEVVRYGKRHNKPSYFDQLDGKLCFSEA